MTVAEYPRYIKQISELERRVRIARSFADLRASEHWQTLSKKLQAAEQQLVSELLSSDFDGEDLHRIRAELRCYRSLLHLCKEDIQQLDEWERHLSHLRQKVAQIQTLGLDKEIPGVNQEISKLQARIGG